MYLLDDYTYDLNWHSDAPEKLSAKYQGLAAPFEVIL